jgi:hypothetical protein
MASSASEGVYACEFIERHCRITKGAHAGELVRLLPWQRDLIRDLFALQHGRRRYRRAYVQMPRKNGKTFLMACVGLYEAVGTSRHAPQYGSILRRAADGARPRPRDATSSPLSRRHPRKMAEQRPQNRVSTDSTSNLPAGNANAKMRPCEIAANTS